MVEVVHRLEIWGRVQGVYYRLSLLEQARRLGVTGWVRNRQDGSVEAMVAGATDAVSQVIAWAQRGPEQAAVSRVDVYPGDGRFDGFEQWDTV